jgi:co-chaperonin GroES (HSP10)
MDAKNLKIGNMKFTLTVDGITDPVEFTIKNVSAKKTNPTAKGTKVVIPKDAAEKATGSTVIATANILSTYKDTAKHVRTIKPTSVTLVQKNVTAEYDTNNNTRILIKKLDGKSGSVKATLTYPGGITKTVTISVAKGK